MRSKNFFLIIFLVFCLFIDANASAVKKKRQHRKKRQRTHVVQPLHRPDLKVVHLTSKPVLFTQAKLSNEHKNKFAYESKHMMAFFDPRESLFNDVVPLNTKISQIEWSNIYPKMYVEKGKYYAPHNGLKLQLTINPELQDAAERFLSQGKGIVSGSTAIIEPRTGQLLALAQGGNDEDLSTSVSSRGPAASLIKIVTSAAAIEKENLDPSFEIFFRGRCGMLENENWIENPEKDIVNMSFDKAFGASCNTFFARLALYHVGLASLKTYAEKFMFNKPIPSDVRIQTSLFLLPDAETATPQEIAEAGSGFGATKLSPIHAALLSATIANGGIMMAPYLVEAAFNQEGHEVYRAHPKAISRVISSSTADKIAVLMLETTSSGTSRRVFKKLSAHANIEDIGGKTGTLLDFENRKILYTWFSGIASIGSPQSISIGTVIASPQNYVVRANAVAQTTLAEYFKIQNN